MYQTLIDEIDLELESMSMIVSDIEILINEVGTTVPTNIHKTALGGFASQFYNGVENIFKRIHKHFKIELPKGDDWHIVLLERFSIESGFAFPVKISKELAEKLSVYRRFRHYFFHGYSRNLKWDILLSGAKDINDVFILFKKEIFNALKKPTLNS
ncbi:MAG: hypothetical protein WCT77_09735 [Bacteroidota bacterium]